VANLTREQVAEIVAKAPPGTSPEGVVAALREQGHVMEGYPSAPAPVARKPYVPPMQVASHPFANAMAGVRPQHLLAMLPAAGATAGGLIGGGATGIPTGGVAGPWGAFAGGALGAAGGRAIERAGLGALGIEPPASISERVGGPSVSGLPQFLRGTLDVGEQALLGGALEGGGQALFGIPGRTMGGLQQAAQRSVGRSERKVGQQALEKERERFAAGQLTAVERDAIASERAQMGVERTRARLAARDIAPEIEAASAATTAARREAGGALGSAIRGAKEEGVEVSVDDLVQKIAARQKDLYGASASEKVLGRQVRNELGRIVNKYTAGAIRLPRGASRLVDAHGKPTPAAPIRFNVEQAENMKKGVAEALRTEFAGIEKGATPKGGLRNLVHRALKEMLEEKVPDIKALNKAAGAAIRESAEVERLAASQPGPTARGLRQTQAERAAAASGRAGARQRPAEEAAKQAARERQAVAIAMHNFRTGPVFQPQLYLSGGMTTTTPNLSRLALGASRLLANPTAAGAGRLAPDAVNLLMRLLMARGEPSGFTGGTMPPDTLGSQ